jgi:hypothetical protein
MLAQDLNYHLARNPTNRFVLFIDEYERVFDQGGAGARWLENPFDRHMRALLQETNGILAVFFSRERLPWGKHPEWRDDLTDNQHLLGGLADKDADDFLKLIPITDEAVRKAIIDGAREGPDNSAGVYPLMLDLQVEHWRSLVAKGQVSPHRFTVTAETFEVRCIEIVERVLRDYDIALQTTTERLSVTRRFDRGAFNHVVTTFGTAAPLDNFDCIAELSFVTKSHDGFLSLHNVVAAAIRGMLTDEMRRTSRARSRFSSGRWRSARRRWEPSIPIQPRASTTSQDCLGLKETMRVRSRFTSGAVAIFEKTLGAEHPPTGASLNNLGGLLESRGDYAGCEAALRTSPGDQREGAGARAPRYGHEHQQPRRTA